MQRTVITPADLSGDALDELKGWLGISRLQEDAQLIGLLGTSASLCEAFTGQAPLQQTFEERIPAASGQHRLQTRPVQSLLSVEAMADDGSRAPLAETAYSFELDPSREACVALHETSGANTVVVSLRAGIAPDWASLPAPLRHGMIRLAAFHFRDREVEEDAIPPASVAALWRPWRLVRLT